MIMLASQSTCSKINARSSDSQRKSTNTTWIINAKLESSFKTNSSNLKISSAENKSEFQSSNSKLTTFFNKTETWYWKTKGSRINSTASNKFTAIKSTISKPNYIWKLAASNKPPSSTTLSSISSKKKDSNTQNNLLFNSKGKSKISRRNLSQAKSPKE